MIKPFSTTAFVLWLHDHRAAPSTCVVGWGPWTGTLRYARKNRTKELAKYIPTEGLAKS